MSSHVLILVRLRWRLLLASFAGKSGRQAAAILGFILILAWAGIFASSSYVLLQRSRDWDAPGILRLIFLSTFLLQLMTSVASLSVSDFFDTSRLMHLPVRARSIFVAMLVSSVLSPSALVFGSPAVGAIVALEGPGAEQFVRGAVVLGVVVFGQASALFAGYLLLGALSRRRLRDAATILGGVLGLGSYALIRLLGQQGRIREWIGPGLLSDILDFVPTSWFSDLMFWTQERGLAGFALPALALAASLVACAWSFSRFYTGTGETTETLPSIRKKPRTSRLLPVEAGAVAHQTLAVIWREPQLKAMLFQQLIFLLIPFVTVPGGKGLQASVSWIPFFMVFSHAWLALSLLGIDGSGLKLLLQTPASRARILLGRVAALGWLFAVIDVVATALLVAAMKLWSGTPDPVARFLEIALACVIADWVLVAAGAFVSVVVPFPIVRRGKHQRMRQEGCATNLGRTLLRLPVMIAAVAVGGLAALPAIFGLPPAWYLATIPCGLCVAAVTSVFTITGGARRLVSREEEIVAALADAGD